MSVGRLDATASRPLVRFQRLGRPPGPRVDPRDQEWIRMSCVWSRTTVRCDLHQGLAGLPGRLEQWECLGIPCRADQDVRGHRVDPGAIAGDGQEGRVGVLHRCEHLPRPAVRRERLVLTAGAIQRNRHVAESPDQLMGDLGIGRVRAEQPLDQLARPVKDRQGLTLPARLVQVQSPRSSHVWASSSRKCSSEGLVLTRSSWSAPRPLERLQPLADSRVVNQRNSPRRCSACASSTSAPDIGGVGRGQILGDCASPLGGRQGLGLLPDGQEQQVRWRA